MENMSKTTIDDSSQSMYFSFNSTTAYKTMESVNDNSSMTYETEDDCEQNNTLEADEPDHQVEEIRTVKKLSFGASPAKALPKNILRAYKALASTPTKAQLLRSVEVSRGSAAVDVCDLGLAFLEAPQESISAALSEDKENIPQESQEIVYSETSSEIVVSVIEKTQEEEKPVVKRVGFSNLPVLKSSTNSNIKYTPKVRRSIPRCEPDLASNRPSRIISSKRMSINPKASSQPTAEFNSEEIPKILNSILKISKGLPPTRKSIGNSEKPFNLLGKATRMSIVKTTLNSPARKLSSKSLTSNQLGRNPVRQSMFATNKRKSTATSVTDPSAINANRRSGMPSVSRKSMLPKSVTSPKKKIGHLNSRQSMMPPIASSAISNSRKSMAPKPTTCDTEPLNTQSKTTWMKPPNNLKEDFVCEVCSRKFRVLSLFEAHKRSHNPVKQNFSSGSDKQCRYCDKKFAIAKALTNHLIQNCTKIPPGDKKKLLFPVDQISNAVQPKSKLPQKSLSNLSSCDSLSSNATQISRSQFIAKNPDSGDGSTAKLPPSSINKLKKKQAHSGVYCTPKKQIPCHICKASFNSILAFTEHKLLHSNAASDVGNISTSTESTQTQIEVKSDGTQTKPLLQEDAAISLN